MLGRIMFQWVLKKVMFVPPRKPYTFLANVGPLDPFEWKLENYEYDIVNQNMEAVRLPTYSYPNEILLLS